MMTGVRVRVCDVELDYRLPEGTALLIGIHDGNETKRDSTRFCALVCEPRGAIKFSVPYPSIVKYLVS
jgi:hypothetical protein